MPLVISLSRERSPSPSVDGQQANISRRNHVLATVQANQLNQSRPYVFQNIHHDEFVRLCMPMPRWMPPGAPPPGTQINIARLQTPPFPLPLHFVFMSYLDMSCHIWTAGDCGMAHAVHNTGTMSLPWSGSLVMFPTD